MTAEVEPSEEFSVGVAIEERSRSGVTIDEKVGGPKLGVENVFMSRSQIVMACHYNLAVCVTTEWKILKFIFSPGIQVQVSK